MGVPTGMEGKLLGVEPVSQAWIIRLAEPFPRLSSGGVVLVLPFEIID